MQSDSRLFLDNNSDDLEEEKKEEIVIEEQIEIINMKRPDYINALSIEQEVEIFEENYKLNLEQDDATLLSVSSQSMSEQSSIENDCSQLSESGLQNDSSSLNYSERAF